MNISITLADNISKKSLIKRCGTTDDLCVRVELIKLNILLTDMLNRILILVSKNLDLTLIDITKLAVKSSSKAR